MRYVAMVRRSRSRASVITGLNIKEKIVQIKTIILATALSGVPGLLHAQFDFKIDGRNVQVHSFGSQGFMYSNQNNYMAMPTSKGSFAMTDGGANVSTSITDKFRVGAQLYIRNVGEFGNWHPELDWAFGDYKFKSWFGVRGGKVKTVFGLLNDVQDMDSLHTFALLPQGIYPTDWRSTTIAHTGGDVYGDIAVKHLGTFSYTGFVGAMPQDLRSGYDYASKAGGTVFTYRGGRNAGGDLRLTMPIGVVIGASYMDMDVSAKGSYKSGNATNPYNQSTNANEWTQYYAQYTLKGLKLDGEYRRNMRDTNLLFPTSTSKSIIDSRSWYVSGTYRISKRLELGAYRSVYLYDTRKDTSTPTTHEYDSTVSLRIDPVNHVYVKIEGHHIDGAVNSVPAARGFYSLSNPTGIKPTTNLFVVRTGFSF